MRTRVPKPTSNLRRAYRRGLAAGYRSGLEEAIAAQLQSHGLPVQYETLTVPYQVPERASRYTPDFLLPNGIIIESKGRFVTADRQKHLLIKAQHPDLDIRFVFTNPHARLSKTSKTTYAAWCERYGFACAARAIPPAWLAEAPARSRLAAIRDIIKEKHRA